MGHTRLESYALRMDKVCRYIESRLDHHLSLNELSQVACFSKYHFSRQFSAYTGIGVLQYVQLMRMRRACYQLVFSKQTPIIEIALDARFENQESFSRAFKRLFAQTPKAFRENPHWQSWCEKSKPVHQGGLVAMKIEITEFAETAVAVLEHHGDAALVNETAARFIEWRKQSGLSPVTKSRTFGVPYGDPENMPPQQFQFDICGEVSSPVPENNFGVVNKILPQGRVALMRHRGPHARLGKSVRFLYGDWLPQSGEELRDFPCFFHYINLLPDVQEHELITDIYIPLK